MENCVASSSLGDGATLSPCCNCNSLSGSMVIELVSPVAEAETAAAMMSAWMVSSHPRLDQIGAKLIEEQKADHEHHKAAQIEDDDAPSERRRKPRG